MDWTILGIASTKDVQAITSAYRTQLKYANPEDDPEKFKALRNAYEEALAYAKQEDLPKSASGNADVDRWMERVRALYGDVRRRIDVNSWKELLHEDACIALDKRPIAEKALLEFFMTDYFLPQSVWQALDDVFSFNERKQQLYESYPPDFVDNVIIYGIRNPSTLPYELFVPGKSAADCDDYYRIYCRARHTSGNELAQQLKQLDALSERHPYGEMLRCRLAIERGATEKAASYHRKLTNAYPNDTVLSMGLAELYLSIGNSADAETQLRHVLEYNPKHKAAMHSLAKCLAARSEYDEAKELLYTLMDLADSNQIELQALEELIKEWNNQIIPQREKRLKEYPDDTENIKELAWCYLQNGKNEDALRLCNILPPESPAPYDYYNLLGKALMRAEEYEKALSHLTALENIMRTMKPDGTKKTEKRIRKLPELLQIEGQVLDKLGRKNEAFEKFEESIRLAPQTPSILIGMACFLFSRWEFDRAADILNQVINLIPYAYHAHYLLADVMFRLRRDQDAFKEVNRAIELCGDLSSYALKLRILLRNGAWEQVRELMSFLKEHGVNDDALLDWSEAQLTEYQDGNSFLALTHYEKLAQRIESGDYLPFASEVYYRIAVLRSDIHKGKPDAEEEALLAVLDKGLSNDPDDINCMDFKAWLLAKLNRTDEALELYHRMELRPDHFSNINRALADLYCRNLSRNAEKALHYYLLLPEHNDDAVLLFYIGTCYRYLYDFPNAERTFLRMQELYPDDIDGWRGLFILYEYMGDYARALEQLNILLSMVQGTDRDKENYYFQKIRLLRHLSCPFEAIDVVDELANKFDYKKPYNLKFEILCQFGLWKDAKALLRRRNAFSGEGDAKRRAVILLNIYTGRLRAAKIKLILSRSGMTLETKKDLMSTLATVSGGYSAFLIDQQLQMIAKNPKNAYNIFRMAEVYFWDGNMELARFYAKNVLELVDTIIPDEREYETMYRSYRSLALAILGRMDEARAELQRIRSMPLCEHCDYSMCKDSYIYEAYFAELCGDYEKAAELCYSGLKQWPDEIDFAGCLNRMKKKGVLHAHRN